MGCTQCPRYCNVDRSQGELGFCRRGMLPEVAMADLHFWEEPCISGSNGSGAVFFSGCNLSCAFCQNYQISQSGRVGREYSVEALASIFLMLEGRGAHNINLVSPTHFSEKVAEAIRQARNMGLKIPFIYNSNGYESLETLEIMDGLIDVYLPDLKYFSDEIARKYSSAPSYFEHASKAILEMSRQVGIPQFDEQGVIQRGLIVRHLVLPGQIEDSKKVLRWIKEELPEGTYVSLMAQYCPVHRAKQYPEINRTLTWREYDEIVKELYDLELEDGYIQELASANTEFIPDFGVEAHEPNVM
ncbi:MAG TPA: radical SAM protein [Bacillota bacterium]|nr:radical SAM protein [Bacillota bacterium]HPZ78169.1 radical SAM protein [Bacillota bacterium]HQD74541.1 radical SAM protein [Bacillota bacterium]